MPQPLTDKLARRLIDHRVDLMRFDAHLRHKVERMLLKVQSDLVLTLKGVDPTAPTLLAWRRRRLEELFQITQSQLRTSMNGIYSTFRKDVLGLAELEAERNIALMNKTIGTNMFSVRVPSQVLTALVDDTLVLGAPAKEWWQRQAPQLMQRFKDEMRAGVLRGDGLSRLVEAVRGSRTTVGIMETSNRNAAALIRTSVQSVANSAQMAAYQANANLMRGVQALSTLDMRTTPICIARSGASWNLETGKALPESPRDESFPGPPPWHWQCRTVLVPIVRPYSDLAKDPETKKKMQRIEKDLPETTQASMDGQVSRKFTFEDWLEDRDDKEIPRYLGKGRYELWKDGKITFSELIDQRGRPLSLAQLKALD